MQRTIKRMAVMVLAAGLWAGLFGGRANALVMRPMKLDEVIAKSDQIFTAVCESKSSEFRDGNIFTTYRLRPNEVWKGTLPLNKDGLIEMEELGGRAEGKILAVPHQRNSDPNAGKVALNQFVGGSSSMIPGEEVLLFTHAMKPNPELEARGQMSPYKPGNLEITGRIFGRFSILTDPATGQKHVTRMGLEDRGVIPSDESVKSYLNSQQKALQASKPAAPGVPVPSSAVLRNLKGSPGSIHQKLQEKATDGKDGGSGEIKNFDRLDEVKERVQRALDALAAGTSGQGTK